MLSRKAICLWLLAVSVCLGLAVSAAVLGQQPAAGAATAGKSEEPTKGGGGGFGGAGVAVGTAESVGASSRSRRSNTGGGGFAGAAVGPRRPPSSSSRSRPPTGGAYGGSYGQPANVYDPMGTTGGRYSFYPYTNRPRPRKPDPEMEKLLEQDAKMEQQAHVFAKQFREAEDQPQRAKVRGNVEVLTKEHFDLRQKRRELELSRLEEQLERVRASIKKRNEVKDLIIQRRVARLLGEEDDLAF